MHEGAEPSGVIRENTQTSWATRRVQGEEWGAVMRKQWLANAEKDFFYWLFSMWSRMIFKSAKQQNHSINWEEASNEKVWTLGDELRCWKISSWIGGAAYRSINLPFLLKEAPVTCYVSVHQSRNIKDDRDSTQQPSGSRGCHRQMMSSRIPPDAAADASCIRGGRRLVKTAHTSH